MASSWKTKGMKELFSTILKLKDEKGASAFFRDLCTLNELGKMSERWKVAKLLSDGMPYRKIAQQTGASTATVTRVAHWLRRGEGGYKRMLTRC